ncbi:Cytochrome P450 [Melia azedarach]|uniref:Cytochrome P450 n=1 Tax=Melia azedarach TaxID=155640 RepID=A0ACC1XUN6_MELAZ|nr:Cytochrome P450 [Melia azedarach]
MNLRQWKPQATLIYSALFLVIFLLAFKFLLQSKTGPPKVLPPGPPSLPIIGHLHLLKPPLHRTLRNLSQKYGSVISLRFGSRLVVTVSSLSVADECFTKNDIVLANRPKLLAGKHIGYNYSNLVTAPYGEHWRNLRRICTYEIFSPNRLNMFLSIRKDEVKRLLKNLSRGSLHGFAKVELRPLLTELTFNNIMRMVSGKRYYGEDVTNDEDARRSRELIAEITENCVAGHPVDFLPILSWIGNNYEKKLQRLGESMDAFLQGLVEDRRLQKDEGSHDTMIDHLLSLQKSQSEYYTDEIIKGLMLVMFIAGTDTSSVTLEWAMSNLLNQPDILRKVRAELDTQLGQKHLMDEPDLPKLNYLQSIIFETLRLHPATPLLLPHMASDDCVVGDYNVPRDTLLFVNAWAIHRDPTLWDDPASFKPERFENGEGEAQKLIMPFGMGRRACPGAGLAHRIMGLALGSLIQCFDWEKIGDQEIDMSEGLGLTLPKAQPLVAMCKARPIMHDILSETM